MSKLEYPTILTKKDWVKKKGLFARMAGKTGTGPLMDTAQTHFHKVKWGEYKCSVVAAHTSREKDLAELTKIRNSTKTTVDKWGKAVAADVKKIEIKTKKLAEDWKKSKTIPKKAREHAEAVNAAAKQFAKDLESAWDNWFKAEFDQFQQMYTLALSNAKKDLNTGMQKLTGGLKKLAVSPSKSTWDKECKQPARTVSNNVYMIKEWRAKFWDVWEKIGDPDQLVKSLKGESEEDQWKDVTRRVADALKQLKAGAK